MMLQSREEELKVFGTELDEIFVAELEDGKVSSSLP
jgi:hypothetical protein